MKKRAPYRVANRAALGAAPPFSEALVRQMVDTALRGPKGRTMRGAPDSNAINWLVTTLNQIHGWFFQAQEERMIIAKIDRARKAVAELRELMPAIVERRRVEADTEREYNARWLALGNLRCDKNYRASQAMLDFLLSDQPKMALVPVNSPASRWQWSAQILLRGGLVIIIGKNAAARFITAATPKLTGENPKPASVLLWLKKQKISG